MVLGPGWGACLTAKLYVVNGIVHVLGVIFSCTAPVSYKSFPHGCPWTYGMSRLPPQH